MKTILLLLCVLFFASCTTEYPKDLGSGFTMQIDDNFTYAHNIMYPNGCIYVVYTDVTDYKFNKTFIVAEQKPLDSFWVRSSSKFMSTADDVEREFRNYKVRQYWIINKHTQESYGPFTKEQYLEKKKELGVPDTLKLQFERHK